MWGEIALLLSFVCIAHSVKGLEYMATTTPKKLQYTVLQVPPDIRIWEQEEDEDLQ